MQPHETTSSKGINLNIHLDESDAGILFLLAIHSDQSLEDVLLGMMEEATSELQLNDTQQIVVKEALAEYKTSGKFEPAKWRSRL
jgi:hypothetical protein